MQAGTAALTLPAAWRVRPLTIAATVLLVFFWIGIQAEPFNGDAAGYWLHLRQPDWYTGTWNVTQAWVYPPPLGLLMQPLVALPLPAFYALWTGLLTLTLAWLVGPVLAVVLLLPPEPFRHEIATGNVHLLIAASLVLPHTWAFLPLTKITPGVAWLWLAMRREWKPLALALAITSGAVLASYVAVPEQWTSWIGLVESSFGAPALPGALAVPILLRLPLAVALVAIGARHRWLLPVAVWVALPNLTLTSLALLAALPRLSRFSECSTWRRGSSSHRLGAWR